MKVQNSISLLDFTDFLEAGALLRDRNEWILVFGHSEPLSPRKDAYEKGSFFSVFSPSFYEVEESEAVRFKNEARLSQANFLKLCRDYLETAPQPPLAWDEVVWKEPDLNDFTQIFSHTQRLISQGQIDKAVPCVFSQAEIQITPATLVKSFLAMSSLPDHLHVYGIWQDGEGTLGATPEILFEKKGLQVSTMALAGTLAKSTKSRGEILLKDKKELHENALVVEDLRYQLRALGHVKVDPVQLMELPTLWHLITRIEMKLENEIDPMDLVKRLHPTPALGVAPRNFGWRWMREWPQQNLRQRFGAPFLMKIDTDHWLCLVAIRNLQWDRKQLLIGSGCGLVRDSELEREWLELFYKRESVKKILGIKQ